MAHVRPLVTLGVLAALAVPAAAQQQIYFCDLFNPTFDDAFVRRVNTDGTGLTTLATPGAGIRGLALDPPNNKMYWCDVFNFSIRRANIDGSGVEDIVSGMLQFPSVVKVDPIHGHIYWGDMLSEEIWRANLDGTDPVSLLGTAFHRGIALDLKNSKIYWTTSISMFRGNINRANLDGTGQQTVVSSQLPEFKPNSIALDVAGNKIYWTDYVVDVLQRANLSDGSNIETLWSAGSNKNPGGIALDLGAGKIYWGADDDVMIHTASIRRMNLDGSDQEVIISDLGSVMELEVAGPGVEPCYPDCNGDGVLNLSDFGCFTTRFALGEPYSDCNGDGIRNLADFGCFTTKFALGCP